MSRPGPEQPEREAGMLLRQFAEQAFSRAAEKWSRKQAMDRIYRMNKIKIQK
jgi:hypothetical protein